jgi:hypothetical protein
MLVKTNSSKVVHVRFIGGLGNQLFQYFAGLYLATQSSSKLVLDFRWINNGYGHKNSDIRDFLQPGFDEETGRTFLIWERIKSKLSKVSPRIGTLLRIHDSYNPGYIRLPAVKDRIELRANYQSPNYYHALARDIPENFWRTPAKELEKSLAGGFDSGKFIAVHVRGGDYLKSDVYEKLDKEYYRAGLKILFAEFPGLPLVLFTDDLDYAREQLDAEINYTYFDDRAFRASQILYIISQAKGMVISNSTFAYWAAISNNNNHIVAPKKWFREKNVDADFFPATWKII